MAVLGLKDSGMSTIESQHQILLPTTSSLNKALWAAGWKAHYFDKAIQVPARFDLCWSCLIFTKLWRDKIGTLPGASLFQRLHNCFLSEDTFPLPLLPNRITETTLH